MTISFRLNKGKRINDLSKPVSLYLRICKGRKVDYNKSLGIQLLNESWDAKKEKVRNKAHLNNKDEINVLLNKIRLNIQDNIWKRERSGQMIDLPWLKQTVHTLLKGDNLESRIRDESFKEFIDKYINNSSKRVSPYTGRPISKSTIKSYQAFQRKLEEFMRENGEYDFEDIDMKFYYNYVEWLERNGYMLNYIGQQIKHVKTFMNAASRNGKTENRIFNSREFRVLKENTGSVFLNQEEIIRINNLDLLQNSSLSNTRDLFVIACNSGFRVSDINSLTSSNLLENQKGCFIVKKPKKTSNSENPIEVIVPVNSAIRKILCRNGGNFPNRQNEQLQNHNLKIIGKMASIDDEVSIEFTKGGKRQNKKSKKYELISTHTGRRSFCTNAYLEGLQPIEIMQISGHKNLDTFLKYIKVDKLKRASLLSEHSFFK